MGNKQNTFCCLFKFHSHTLHRNLWDTLCLLLPGRGKRDPRKTHIVAAVTNPTPGPLPCHQKVHLGLPWTWAVQRLPASVDRVLRLLPVENPTTVMMQQMP